MNLCMQLRKCCNHPYLFKGVEPGPPYTTGAHLIESSGKLVVLDKLLPRLLARGSRCLIFSQMTRMLDILEDYCLFKGFSYVRIDGNTGGDDRQARVEAFEAPDSSIFLFLLSTRAGGLGLTLTGADTVILYDSDWNPQMDLQAMDRAHRIGQTKEVTVFRFCVDHSIEEKVLEMAFRKLRLDALVMQQGHLADGGSHMKKGSLLAMVNHGYDQIKDMGDVAEEDIDAIMERSKRETAAFDEQLEAFERAAQQFSNGGGDLRQYETPDEQVSAARVQQKIGLATAEMLGKRERRPRFATKTTPAEVRRLLRLPPNWDEDHNFFDRKRLSVRAVFSAAEGLSADQELERARLAAAGFSWSKTEYRNFVAACAKCGQDTAEIARVMGKDAADVKAYAEVFWVRGQEISTWKHDLQRITEGHKKVEADRTRERVIAEVVAGDFALPQRWNSAPEWTEDQDMGLLRAVDSVGWGRWEEVLIQLAVDRRTSLDSELLGRSPEELAKRARSLASQLEKMLERAKRRRVA
jgi:SWI/SNF-related matrix-associated actin-dependent regulator of chromatin subfamily A member 5